MKPLSPIILGALIFLSAASTTYSLLIGSFNIRIFGQSKSDDFEVMDIIIRIIEKYDIILIQEVRDGTDYTLSNLMEQLNSPGSKFTFKHIISERLGSTDSKEQYLFLIRSNSGISLSGKHQFRDKKKFERPPFAIQVRSKYTGVKRFILMAIHIKPVDAVNEIDNLIYAWDVVKRKWNTDNILIMGDLNAGCNYASKTALNRLDIRYPPFRWLIPDSAITTVLSQCPYDRFIMSGARFLKSLVAKSPKVYRYDKALKISYDLTAAVSDHYPIELRLKGSERTRIEDFVNDSATSKFNLSIAAFFIVGLFYVCL